MTKTQTYTSIDKLLISNIESKFRSLGFARTILDLSLKKVSDC